VTSSRYLSGSSLFLVLLESFERSTLFLGLELGLDRGRCEAIVDLMLDIVLNEW
jgi:hypothetical protein